MYPILKRILPIYYFKQENSYSKEKTVNLVITERENNSKCNFNILIVFFYFSGFAVETK